ncbi:hypothetical protein BDB00DRAFT_870037 [Zychaea mexicana]|uniref:uncharacterized protein n=1 Tax=Zychaea mexicana TaxID=64656 RepID=UPI0022FE1F1F|nr:uncharacterized protein BDB00DRAFT_870037 [Zychaea mexicana]KAI9495815.1 hypothetical protein BDB00DRAFT_870037 [Zychaea mexicana]
MSKKLRRRTFLHIAQIPHIFAQILHTFFLWCRDKSWKELVIRWKNIEYLALGGYVGLLPGTRRRAFLGSALNDDVVDIIEEREFEILVPSSPVSYVQSPRYLRSYAKSAAFEPWSYTSKRYIRNGFEACHGLVLDNYPKRTKKQMDKSWNFIASIEHYSERGAMTTMDSPR